MAAATMHLQSENLSNEMDRCEPLIRFDVLPRRRFDTWPKIAFADRSDCAITVAIFDSRASGPHPAEAEKLYTFI